MRRAFSSDARADDYHGGPQVKEKQIVDGAGDEQASDADHPELGELVNELSESLILCPGNANWPFIPYLFRAPVPPIAVRAPARIPAEVQPRWPA